MSKRVRRQNPQEIVNNYLVKEDKELEGKDQGETKIDIPKETLSADPTLTKEERLQRNIEETKDVIEDNIKRMMERGEKLEDMGVTMGQLEMGMEDFHRDTIKTEKETARLNRRSWRWCAMIGFSLVLIVVALAIVAIMWH